MIVIVDSNEVGTSRKTIKELLRTFPDLIGVTKETMTKLTCGDLNIILDDGSLLAIERKEVHDFLASIADGRVFKQVEDMANNAKYYAIIIEGSLQINYDVDMAIADGEITGWKGSSVRGALYSIMWSGCPVVFTPNGCYAETAEELAQFVSKDDERFQRNHRRVVTFPPVEDEGRDIFMAFTNIGHVRSESMWKFLEERKDGEVVKQPALAEALSWGTMLKKIHKGSRPRGWGDAAIDSLRKDLGLRDGQYLDIIEEETIGEENET